MSNPTTNAARGSTHLTALRGGKDSSLPELRAGGVQADESMRPDKYVATCEGATLTKKGGSTIAVLQFRVRDGSFAGVALRQWIGISEINGVVSPGSRYWQQCSVALGGSIPDGEALNPDNIFTGKTFVVSVGYRLTTKGRGGPALPENALTRKDEKDFLRVQEIRVVLP